MSKKRIAGLGAAATSAALVGSALFAPAAMAQEEAPTPEAFAVGAEGLVNIAKTPHAVGTSDPGPVVEIPGDPLVHVKALNAKSEPGKAKSEVLDVTLLNKQIHIEALTAKCVQGEVTSDIASLTIAGQTVPIDTNPNTGIPAPLDKVIDITANQQIENPDGSTTVNALQIELLKGADKALGDLPIAGPLAGQTITLASATCAPTDDGGDDGDNPGDDNPGDDNPGDDNPGDDNPGDGDNNNGGDKDNGGDKGGDNGGADDANADGTAPQPVPQPGHISVTG